MSASPAYVEGLVPFVHVRDVMRSTAFYAHFGFEVRNTYEEDGRRVWCWLERHQARLMLAQADAPIVSSLSTTRTATASWSRMPPRWRLRGQAESAAGAGRLAPAA